MNQLIVPADAADLLRADLERILRDREPALSIGCTPLSQQDVAAPPHASLSDLGGSRTALVCDRHLIAMDLRADTWKQAHHLASLIYAAACSLPADPQALSDWRAVEGQGLPYENPDPDHPGPRMSCTLLASSKAEVITGKKEL